MSATHDKQIQITILLDPPPAGVAGFVPLLLADQNAGNTLDGDRVRVYLDVDDVSADESSSFISSFVADALRRAFSQNPSPAAIKVGRVDTLGGESYDQALDAIRTVDPDFYGIALDSRAPADQIAVAQWAEARDKICALQSDDPLWLTAGIATDYTAIGGFEKTAILYHDRTTRAEEFSWLCNRLAFGPDETSAPWDCSLFASIGYITPLNSTQQGHAEDNNVNLLLPFGNADHYVANNGVGVNLAGRQISEIVTKHWFKARLQEAVSRTKIAYSARGQKIPVSLEGVGIVEPLVNSLLIQGEDTGHFVAGQTITDFPIPTAADIEAARIRGGGRAQLATSAGLFVFSLVFSRQPVIEAE